MKDDITLIYYTANLVERRFAENVREKLLEFGLPIVSVSHKPIDFGFNICVGDIGVSIYNIYKQVLIGAEWAKTEFVACCEDDALYVLEHFQYRGNGRNFCYNMNRWNVNEDVYFHRRRVNMSMCIAPRHLLIDTLRKRFEKYPQPLVREKGELIGFGEPGRSEHKLGLPTVPMEMFHTEVPTLVFNHRPSVGGVRKIMRKDTVKKELPFWGRAEDLWERMWNGRDGETSREDKGPGRRAS